MNPHVPTTFPGKCVTNRDNRVEGYVDRLAGKWVFTSINLEKVIQYPFSHKTGWTDYGNLAYPPSYTPQHKIETAYLENGVVVCLDPIK